MKDSTKTKGREHHEEEKRKMMAEVSRKMEGLAKKLGKWNPQATIRKFRDTNFKGDSRDRTSLLLASH